VAVSLTRASGGFEPRLIAPRQRSTCGPARDHDRGRSRSMVLNSGPLVGSRAEPVIPLHAKLEARSVETRHRLADQVCISGTAGRFVNLARTPR